MRKKACRVCGVEFDYESEGYRYKKCEKCRTVPRSVLFKKNNPEKHRAQNLDFYNRNSGKIKENWKVRARESKIACLVAYSETSTPSCRCCRETKIQFLTIEHINGEGRKHRLSLGARGNTFYRKLVALGFPQEPPLEVLCFNCNCGKRVNGGICPHEEKD